MKEEGFQSSGAPAYKFVMYYADWCGHCKVAKPEFQKLGSTMTIGGKPVQILMVNPDTDPEACSGKDIKGYPTIHLYDPDGKLVNEYAGQRTKENFQACLNTYVK